MSNRSHSYAIAVAGGRGTGKTTFTQGVVEKTKKPRVLVMDTFYHPMYQSQYAQIQDQELGTNWKGKRHYSGSDFDHMLSQIEHKLKNSLIIFEDAGKYIDENPQKAVRRIVLDSKQRNNDVLFMFHSVAEIPKKFFRWLDFLELFKTQERIEEQKSRLLAYNRVKPVFDLVMASPDRYIHQTIDLRT